MKSPFPGMDPYLERRWPDVHQSICTYARDAIESQLGSDLVARLGERLVVESTSGRLRPILPDISVVDQGVAGSEWTATAMAVGSVVAEPVVVSVLEEAARQGFVEIWEGDASHLITVIEFLSPSNKIAGDGRDKYRQKQQELYSAGVNMVEIDLVRAGSRSFLLPEAQFPAHVSAEYFVCVFREPDKHRFELYPLSIRETLPGIRIPLRRNEPDIALNLQWLIDEAYRKGRYERTDYTKPCDPPLERDLEKWADELLRAAGRR